MPIFILFGHGMNGDVKDAATAIEVLGVVHYREDGVFLHGGRAGPGDNQYLRFTVIHSTHDGVVIACHGERPAQERIDEALSATRLKYSWK